MSKQLSLTHSDTVLFSNPFYCISIFEIHCLSCAVLCLVAQLCTTLCCPMHYSLPGSFVHGILQARILEWVAMPSSRGSFQPRIELRSPILQEDSVFSEPQGKPKSTGVGNLSLFQGIFPTQESNWGLLYCSRFFTS